MALLSGVVLHWIAGSSALAGDFTCAKVHPSEIYKPSYARIGKTNVCEGFYDREVARPFFELVSLTAESPEQLSRLTKDDIFISAALTRRQPSSLYIQPLSVAKPYRVDALLPASGFLRWDVRQIRAATDAALQSLGFLSIVASDGIELLVVPVHIGTSRQVIAPKAAYATVRVSEDVAKFKWRSYPLKHPKGTVGWTQVNDGYRYAEEWATVEVPLTDGAGSTLVEFTATDSTGKSFRPLRFIIQGPADERP